MKLWSDVLLVELIDLLTRLALSVQSLQQQVVRFGRRVVGVFGDFLNLVGIHLVPEMMKDVMFRAQQLLDTF